MGSGSLRRRRQITVLLFVAMIAGFRPLIIQVSARPLEGELGPEESALLLSSLPRGSTPGPSRCTNVPGNKGGGRCPAVSEMHFAGVHTPPVAVPQFHDYPVPRFATSADNETLRLQGSA
ncbi:hypothetical protein H6P81_015511 [Aristolochia fimbriata]|uniref:Uncharacterized protein n=1 Tax=Aristolochia fimbriata TaxID=158543 RepID=A0AAV7E715_ARIFI|nr:hypothetical protein H6P81_015511 [Aristolochia fimbriata]